MLCLVSCIWKFRACVCVKSTHPLYAPNDQCQRFYVAQLNFNILNQAWTDRYVWKLQLFKLNKYQVSETRVRKTRLKTGSVIYFTIIGRKKAIKFVFNSMFAWLHIINPYHKKWVKMSPLLEVGCDMSPGIVG